MSDHEDTKGEREIMKERYGNMTWNRDQQATQSAAPAWTAYGKATAGQDTGMLVTGLSRYSIRALQPEMKGGGLLGTSVGNRSSVHKFDPVQAFDQQIGKTRPRVNREHLHEVLEIFSEEIEDTDGFNEKNDAGSHKTRMIKTGAYLTYKRENVYSIIESFHMGFSRHEIEDFLEAHGEAYDGINAKEQVNLSRTDFEVFFNKASSEQVIAWTEEGLESPWDTAARFKSACQILTGNLTNSDGEFLAQENLHQLVVRMAESLKEEEWDEMLEIVAKSEGKSYHRLQPVDILSVYERYSKLLSGLSGESPDEPQAHIGSVEKRVGGITYEQAKERQGLYSKVHSDYRDLDAVGTQPIVRRPSNLSSSSEDSEKPSEADGRKRETAVRFDRQTKTSAKASPGRPEIGEQSAPQALAGKPLTPPPEPSKGQSGPETPRATAKAKASPEQQAKAKASPEPHKAAPEQQVSPETKGHSPRPTHSPRQ